MAVGKGSMERASKAVAKPAEVKAAEPVKAETKAEVKAPAAKPAPAKKPVAKKASPVKKTAVVTGTNEQVMNKIVYQSSSQLLERAAEPNESFYVGDDMPIYYF